MIKQRDNTTHKTKHTFEILSSTLLSKTESENQRKVVEAPCAAHICDIDEEQQTPKHAALVIMSNASLCHRIIVITQPQTTELSSRKIYQPNTQNLNTMADAQACTYAAMLLHDAGVAISSDKIAAVIAASGLEVRSTVPILFANFIAKKPLAQVIAAAGAAAPAAGAAAASAAAPAANDSM